MIPKDDKVVVPPYFILLIDNGSLPGILTYISVFKLLCYLLTIFLPIFTKHELSYKKNWLYSSDSLHFSCIIAYYFSFSSLFFIVFIKIFRISICFISFKFHIFTKFIFIGFIIFFCFYHFISLFNIIFFYFWFITC